MYRRLLSLLFMLTAFLSAVDAVPAKRGQWRTVRLADGTSVRVELRGDEWAHYWQSRDARIFVADSATAGDYRETTLDAVCKSAEGRRSVAAERRARRLRQQARARRADTVRTQEGAITGTKKGLVILVGFADKAFESDHTQALYDRIFNESGCTEASFKGSVSDYFNDQSHGKLRIMFDVMGPVTVSKGYAYYGANDTSGNDMHPTEMVREALDLIRDSVDFSDYDWDGDGEADQVFVLYAGHGEADYSDIDPATIWPHEWTLTGDGSPAPVYDGIRVDTYACSNELSFDGMISGIGTVCHEFAHCLGFPDEYDMNGRNFGMDRWSLMDYGSYNGGDDEGYLPSGFTSYEKMVAGWLTPVVLSDDTVTVRAMQPLADADEAYIVYNEAYPDEYYLLENRQPTGWDAAQRGSGLLILHVDYDADIWSNNCVNTFCNYLTSEGVSAYNDHQRCTVFHADNSEGIEDADLEGDPYPSGSNDALSPVSVPATVVYHAGQTGSVVMDCSVSSIMEDSEGRVSFVYSPVFSSGIAGRPLVPDDASVDSDAVYTLDGVFAGTSIDSLPHGVYIHKGRKIVK